MHVVVIFATIYVLQGKGPVLLLILLGIATSIGLADLSQRYIEVPTMEFGRRLARRLSVVPASPGPAARLPPPTRRALQHGIRREKTAPTG